MVDTIKPVEKAMVAFEVCLKEVPMFAAQSVETSDYVHHFCGLECYTPWKEQAESKEQYTLSDSGIDPFYYAGQGNQWGQIRLSLRCVLEIIALCPDS